MKFGFSTALIVTFLILSTGCETIVRVDLPPHESQLVTNGFFTPDSLWQVRLSNTVSFTDLAKPSAVNDAVVEIWTNNQKLTTLEPIGDGRYLSTSKPPASSDQYSIRIQADGFKAVEGVGTMPPEMAQANLTHQLDDTDAENRIEIKFKLTLQDPSDRTNYYSLMVLQQLVANFNGEILTYPFHQTTFKTNDPVLRDGDFFDTEPIYLDQATFDDNLINGRSYELDFALDLFQQNTTEISSYKHTFNVVLLEMSEDMFTFRQTAERQREAENDPFSEPVQVYSNMSNGFGIFAGYRAQVFPVTVEDVN